MDGLVERIREHFKTSAEAESQIRTAALEDLRFAAGEQWPEAQKRQRDIDGRPTLVSNRINSVVKQITNEQRQQKPAITISPVGDGADEETAEILQGLIRHIEYQSNADAAYDHAMEFAVIAGGPGWIRVITDYCDEHSFDQEIYIKRVQNPFTVYADPAAQEPDYSDAQYMLVVEDLTADQFREQFPQSELASKADFQSVGDGEADWISRDSVRVAEYWYIETQDATLVKLQDGTTALIDDVPPGAAVAQDRAGNPITRKTQIKRVRMCKTNGVEILEENEWAGKFIPIVPVLGDEVIIDGERSLVGIVRAAKDPCRMYNYWISAQTESIALAPRTPFVGTKKQFEGFEGMWKQANVKNYPFLPYNSDANAPPPQRQQFEPAIQAITMAIAQADNDIKATTGVYDASLGAPGPEQSGRAILARQQQGSTANLHFSDNLARSLKHLGRILVDLIPKVYDTHRVVRIIGDDEQQKTATIAPGAANLFQMGLEKVYDLTVGRYDVAVSMGPSYASRRQEAVQSIMQLVQAFPPFMQISGDILLRNMDIPGAQQLADRAAKMIPPQLQDGAEAPPSPQIQALMQQHQQLVQQLHAASDVINSKKLELDSKERIAAMQTWAQLATAESKLNAQAALQMIAQEKEKLMSIQGMAHDVGLRAMDAGIQAHNMAHDAEMQSSDQQFSAQQQAAAQAAQQNNPQPQQ